MASLHKEKDRGRDGYRLRFRDHNQKQRALWLGKVSRRSADTVLRHIAELVRAKNAGVNPETDSVKWSESIDGRLRDRLATFGLVRSNGARKRPDEQRLLGPFIDRYIEERTDAQRSTVTNYRHAKLWLVAFFDEKKLLSDITPADCDRLQRFLHEGDKLAPSTIEKILKRAKTMFRHAVRDRLLSENPFADVKIGASVNRTRDAFVSPELARVVLSKCPDHDWKAIFALARYAGLRTPSEVLSLKWSDVNWAEGKLRIDSPKTGLRYCPLFPELRPILEAARAVADEQAEWVVSKYRSSQKNLRTRLGRILEASGITVWPKLFVNLRASRRTELQELFPDHVVNAWLGHSSRTAEKYYLQVTPDHWTKAVSGGNAGGNIHANPEASTAPSGQKKQEICPLMGTDSL